MSRQPINGKFAERPGVGQRLLLRAFSLPIDSDSQDSCGTL